MINGENKKIILALDELGWDEAIELVKKVGHLVYAVKIHNLYDQFGPGIVQKLKNAGVEKVWVDHKLHDIPNTVRLRAKDIEADIISVHASGGVAMMREAVASGKEILAITALTSLSPEEVKQIYGRIPEDTVLTLARLAREAGVSGVVCSPQEVKIIRSQEELKGLKIVVPGTRSLGMEMHDQARVSTPGEAIRDGADYLVVGRQITEARDPTAEIQKITEEIKRN